MKNYVRKIAVVVTLATYLVLSCAPINADATEVTRLTLNDLGVASHTPDEIRNFIKKHPSTFLSTNN